MFEWNYDIFHNNYKTFRHMITSLYVWIYHGCKTMSMEMGDYDVIDDIIKSKSISPFWTAVTWLTFKLERRTKAQNVVNWTGSLDVVLISKSSQSLQLSSLSYQWSYFWKSPIAFSSFCLSVFLSGWRLLVEYRSHRLTNHHQTWLKHVSR